MDPNTALVTIGLAATGIKALLEVIGNLKAQHGLTDDQIMTRFADHGEATKAAIAGYLQSL